jgi:hypothetical protein
MSAPKSQISTGLLDEFNVTNMYPGNLLFCGSCGTTAFINNPAVLDSCCDGCKGIDDFNYVKFDDSKTVVTTISSSTADLSPETPDEIEFVGTLRSYFQTSNEFSSPEERVLMLNALKALHYKSIWKAFKDVNPESTMSVEEFREMLEDR